jgi:hypothetical protein
MGEMLTGGSDTSRPFSLLDDGGAEQVAGFQIRAIGCMNYVANDIVSVISKPRYGAGDQEILTHVGLAFCMSGVMLLYDRGD